MEVFVIADGRGSEKFRYDRWERERVWKFRDRWEREVEFVITDGRGSE